MRFCLIVLAVAFAAVAQDRGPAPLKKLSNGEIPSNFQASTLPECDRFQDWDLSERCRQRIIAGFPFYPQEEMNRMANESKARADSLAAVAVAEREASSDAEMRKALLAEAKSMAKSQKTLATVSVIYLVATAVSVVILFFMVP